MLASPARRLPSALRLTVGLILAVAVAGPASAATPGWPVMPLAGDGSGLSPRIVNGVPTSQYPSTGALLYGEKVETAQLQCGGTLIGCRTFLTAAHCVCGSSAFYCQSVFPSDPRDFHVYLQHAGIFDVESIAIHPDFSFDAPDVAVLRLGRPVDGIAPSEIDDVAAPSFGTPGTIVGFGRTEDIYSYGLKRVGQVTTESCSFPSNDVAVCWRYEPPIGPPGTDSDTCYGDAGGPLFATVGGRPSVAGIASSEGCYAGDPAYSANVFTYADFIASQAGEPLDGETCGCLGSAGSSDSPIFSATGSITEQGPDGRHQVVVPDGTVRLVVTLNGEQRFSDNDFDLYVRRGSPPTTALFDCRQASASQFAACEFERPISGNWYVLVRRASGQGTYQVTATAFGAGDGTSGSACDDGNPCTSGDTCTRGACVGSPLSGVACDDGDACTANDRCVGGECLSDAVSCEGNADECHEAAACHPSLGCTLPPKPDFTPCDGGGDVACSFPSQCIAGVCQQQPDPDGDHVCSFDDNCLGVANADQLDTDHDRIGNACDANDGPLRIQHLELTGRSAPSASDGAITLRAEFTAVDRDVFDGTRGVTLAMTDGLNLSRRFAWPRGKCEVRHGGTVTRCTRQDGGSTIAIRRLPSTTPGAVTYVVKFRASGLAIDTPFTPPMLVFFADGPGRLVRGTDRVGKTGNCRSTQSGLDCLSPYAGPLQAFLAAAPTSLFD
ncbi:MAG TPA: trypsin-like serine protease [Candidatus Binatia bacterium]|nr:trypsin-like serine protease [Candidatus Binatia bacterium]